MIKARTIIETLQRIDERNVVNANEIQDFIDDFKRDVRDPSIKKWLDGAARKYIFNDISAEEVPLSANAPEWQRQAVARGEKLYKVQLHNYLWIGRMHHYLEEDIKLVLRYFESEDAPKRPDAVTFMDAVDKARTWAAKKEKEERDIQDPEGTEEIVRDGSMRWVQINSNLSLDREGDLMHHCLSKKTYHPGWTYYSLRDAKNKPHFTFEIDHGYLNQAKGYSNGAIEPKYRDMTIEFLNKHANLKGTHTMGNEDLANNLEAHWDEDEEMVVDGGEKTLTEKEILAEYDAGRVDEDDAIRALDKLSEQHDGELELDHENEEKQTLLLLAAEKTDSKLVDYLLQYGANYNHQDTRGENFFFYVAKHGHYSTYLFDYFVSNTEEQEYIEWEAKNFKDMTVLDTALEDQDFDVIETLQKIGADFTHATDSMGRDILQVAILDGYIDIEDYCDSDTIEHVDKEGNTPLHTALMEKDPDDYFEILIKHDPDLEHKNKKGQTPLHLAIEGGHDDAIDYLLDQLKQKIEPYIDELIKVAKSKNYDDIAERLETLKYSWINDRRQMSLF
jgi:ankyrin repeat protein